MCSSSERYMDGSEDPIHFCYVVWYLLLFFCVSYLYERNRFECRNNRNLYISLEILYELYGIFLNGIWLCLYVVHNTAKATM